MYRSNLPAARVSLVLALFVAVAGLSACSLNDQIAKAGSIDYKSASAKLPPLDVPPDLVSPRSDDRFAVPDVGSKQQTLSGYESALAAQRPAGDARVLPKVPGIRMVRAGNERWLVVDESPAELWPKIRDFWQESGFTIKIDSPETGIMETDWAENRAKLPQDIIRRTIGRVFSQLYSTGERDKFRTRLERGSGGTEIYISQRGMEEVYTDADKTQTTWQPRPPDPELEAEFLRRLMLKLGAPPERVKQQMADTAKPAPGRAVLVTEGGQDVLRLQDGFDRAWRQVGLVLDRVGFTVEDRDRSQGDYYVRYIDPEANESAKPGFFARLFSRSSAKKGPEQQYRIKLTGEGATTRVVVLARDGKPLATETDRRTASKILGLLREQLQ